MCINDIVYVLILLMNNNAILVLWLIMFINDRVVLNTVTNNMT